MQSNRMNGSSMSRIGWGTAVAVIGAAAAVATPAFGQAFQLGGNQPSNDELLAQQWYLMTIEALAGQGKPQEDQYTRASILLEQALEFAPEDADLWGRRAELAQRTGNEDARVEALREYVDLNPDDDRAQLELIRARLQSVQTVDGRLRRYERILDSELAEQFSKPLRSRLASEAATAAREMGGSEDQRFLRHLKTALDLDPSNEQAALMMYQLLRARHRSPDRPEAPDRRVASAAIFLTKAAPLDGTVRGTLGEHLAEQALYERAAQQLNLAQQLTGGRISKNWHKTWIRSLGASGQTQAALQQLNRYRERLATGAATQSAATQPGESLKQADDSQSDGPATGDDAQQQPAGPGGEATGDGEPANTGGTADAGGTDDAGGDDQAQSAPQLPLHMRMLQLAILYQPPQSDRWQAVFDQIWQDLSAAAENGDREARLQAAWLAAVFNRQTETARDWLETLPGDQATVRLAKGWLAFHAGNSGTARSHLSAIAGQDPLARFGLALIDGEDEAGKAQRLRDVVKSAPQSLGGLLAARWLRERDEAVEATNAGRSLVALMDSMPSALWTLSDPSGWVFVDWARGASQFDYLRPMTRTLVVRNRTNMPLSIGDRRTLPSQTLVMIRPYRGAEPIGQLPPKVVDIGRRLTLAPNSSLRMDVRLDRSHFGRLTLASPFRSFVFNVSATVNPRSTRRGIAPGLIGGQAEMQSLVTRSLPPTRSNVESWLATLDDPASGDVLLSLARLAQVTVPEETDGGGEDGDNGTNGDEGDDAGGSPQNRQTGQQGQQGQQGQPGQPSQQGQPGQPSQQGQGGQQAEPVDQALVDRIEQKLTQVYRDSSAERRAWIVRVIGISQASEGRFQQIRDLARRSSDPLVRIAYLANHVTEPDAPTIQQARNEQTGAIQTYAAAVQKALERQAKAEEEAKQQEEQGGEQAGDERGAPTLPEPGATGDDFLNNPE